MSAADLPGDRLLLVYQMAKVASMSWVALGRRQFGIAEPVHVHYLAQEHLEFLRNQYEATGSGQTILRRLLLRSLLHAGAKTRAMLDEFAVQTRPMLLVTGIRDPVARSVSLMSFAADFSGHRGGALSWPSGAAVADLVRAFIGTWEKALSGEKPEDAFGRLMCFFVGAYRWWFDRELRTVFGIDVARESFPPGPASRVLSLGKIDVLVYRVEDMVPQNPGHAILSKDVQLLSRTGFSGFPVHNAAVFRNSRMLHRTFLTRLRMPPGLLDRIYEDQTVRQFYSSEEIARFRHRWLTGPEQ